MYQIGNAFEQSMPWHKRHPGQDKTVAPFMASAEKRPAGE